MKTMDMGDLIINQMADLNEMIDQIDVEETVNCIDCKVSVPISDIQAMTNKQILISNKQFSNITFCRSTIRNTIQRGVG